MGITCALRRFFRVAVIILLGLVAQPIHAAPPLGPIPAEAAGPSLDPAAATRAYLATVPAAAHARSDAYSEGGYWLILWNALLTSAVALLLLNAHWSAAWRDRAARLTRRPNLQVAVYALIFNLVSYAFSFPLLIYQDFFREHQYGMATQNFGQWFGQQMIGLAVSTVFLTLLLMALYVVFRRATHLVAVGQCRGRLLSDGRHRHRAKLH